MNISLGALSLVLHSLVSALAIEPRYSVVERLERVPNDWVDVATPSPSKLIELHLAVHPEKVSEFEQRVIEISTPGNQNYGHHMSRDEIRGFLYPSDVAPRKVLSWLEAAHIPAASIHSHTGWIAFTVPVSRAEQLLRTRFYTFEHKKSKATVVRTLKYSVPKDIRSFVQMIQPTTRFGQLMQQAEPPLLHALPVTPKDLLADCPSIITPSCLHELYGIPNSKPKSDRRNRLGVSGFLGQYARYTDFHQFLQLYAPNTADTNYTVVLVNGGLNLQDSVEDGSEASLDIQYAATLADNPFTTFYSTAGRGPFIREAGHTDTSNPHEPYLEQLRYLLDLPDDELPAVLSTSYGELEQDVPEIYARTICHMLAQLGARGVSVIFSSGDSGVGESCITNDGTDRTRFQQLFPASCPFVTSVGGTYGREPEMAIGYSTGGFSEYFLRPSYQSDSVNRYLRQLGPKWEGLYNPNGRGIPDVAAQADHYIIMDHGQLLKTGGTSAAAPVFAGIVSRLNAARLEKNKPRLGFLNPWLYSLNQTGFTDIVDGGSVGCFGDVGRGVPSADLRTLVPELHNALNRKHFDAANDLLSRAKRTLLLQNALIPTSSTSPELIAVAREVLELGALSSIRQTDAPSFTRYYQQLQPFYDLERDSANAGKVDFKTSQRSKITGLYLLLLLSMGDSTSFHTVLEGLVEEASLKGKSIEDDPCIKYPVELERNLMEGSYDKVWRETKSERVPSEDFGLFSNVLVGTIRSEIADCSEKAYPSLPISNAKNLLFLESEGAVIEFAEQRGWVLRDGRIYFPVEPEAAARSEKDILVASTAIIENAIGYARELETIV
ncbi:subtilisin-like protein [Aspergillus bertholletiae]|uniref:tripeptidyl-peptidase II n=1 Tax=Aspergillus bertholletiae TaxID=1226010 RepID=A0A5N7BM28_9EURO|nr:subtilisin-like protein [Aspergillus bertholletiae]